MYPKDAGRQQSRSSDCVGEMLTGLLLASLLLLLWFVYPRKPKGLPPGRWGWPVIGALPTAGISFVEETQQLRKTHGDIVSWRIGSHINVFLFNYKTIRAVFSKAGSDDRPGFFSFKSTSLFVERGIFSSSGTIWSRNRRFALRHLKDLGMGKTRLGDAIQEEAAALVENFRKHTGRPQVLPWSINVAVVNVIWRMIADKRYDLDDEEIIAFNKRVNDMVLAMEGPVRWLDLFDWLAALIPRSLKQKLGLMAIYDNTKGITDYFVGFIDNHRKTLDPENPRDLIDAYLIEMDDPNSDLVDADSIENLKIMILNLFVAGSDTGASTIRWALLYMAKYPDIQTKVQEEIDDIVPRDTLPSLQHRDQMPYMDAMINEVHRLVSLTPLSVPHATSQDIVVNGFTIPKNSVLMPHILSCHTDPAYWEKPFDFYPEHFLDADGKTISKKEGFLPFGSGRRSCVGENLARMELFLFLSSLLQNFTFTPADKNVLSTKRRETERLSNLPSEFKLIITSRK